MNSIHFNSDHVPASRASSPAGQVNPDELSAQLRDLESQQLDLKNQISELKNNTNLDEELKKKQIDKLEDMVKALEEQIAAVKKQQNSSPAQTEIVEENKPLDFSNLPNHQPDEFVKSDMLSHSPSGQYEFSEDKQGNLIVKWDKPDENQKEQDPKEIQ